jgi:hypothetical protein
MPFIRLLYKTNTIQCTPSFSPSISASTCASFCIYMHVPPSSRTHSMTKNREKANLPIPVIAPTIYYKKDIRPREVFEFCFSGSVRAGFSNQNRLNSCVYTAISSTHEIRWLFVCVVWSKRAARVVKRGTKLCGVVCENPKYVCCLCMRAEMLRVVAQAGRTTRIRRH